SYLPEKLEGRIYYTPTDRGEELRLREYLETVRRRRVQRDQNAAPRAAVVSGASGKPRDPK
ncbi:MAG: recombination factor protein RarA, partial [Candidatus Binataceae bacterium]